jgi:hypothetical protein
MLHYILHAIAPKLKHVCTHDYEAGSQLMKNTKKDKMSVLVRNVYDKWLHVFFLYNFSKSSCLMSAHKQCYILRKVAFAWTRCHLILTLVVVWGVKSSWWEDKVSYEHQYLGREGTREAGEVIEESRLDVTVRYWSLASNNIQSHTFFQHCSHFV